jgi:hypothetical protein
MLAVEDWTLAGSQPILLVVLGIANRFLAALFKGGAEHMWQNASGIRGKHLLSRSKYLL